MEGGGKRSAAATWESFLVVSDHELDRHIVQQMNHGLSKHEGQICLAQDCLQIVFLLRLFIQNIAKFCSLTRNYFFQYSLVNIYTLVNILQFMFLVYKPNRSLSVQLRSLSRDFLFYSEILFPRVSVALPFPCVSPPGLISLCRPDCFHLCKCKKCFQRVFFLNFFYTFHDSHMLQFSRISIECID